jgi:hypothetical protein
VYEVAEVKSTDPRSGIACAASDDVFKQNGLGNAVDALAGEAKLYQASRIVGKPQFSPRVVQDVVTDHDEEFRREVKNLANSWRKAMALTPVSNVVNPGRILSVHHGETLREDGRLGKERWTKRNEHTRCQEEKTSCISYS